MFFKCSPFEFLIAWMKVFSLLTAFSHDSLDFSHTILNMGPTNPNFNYNGIDSSSKVTLILGICITNILEKLIRHISRHDSCDYVLTQTGTIQLRRKHGQTPLAGLLILLARAIGQGGCWVDTSETESINEMSWISATKVNKNQDCIVMCGLSKVKLTNHVSHVVYNFAI